MANNMDIHVCNIMIPGTLASDIAYPLFHVPAKGGAITLLEAQYTVGTEMFAGSVNLYYGSLSADGGTCVPEVCVATAIGTGGGTFPPLSPKTLDLQLTPCVIPADNWLSVIVGTAPDEAQQYVTLAYVLGRQAS